MEITKSSIEFFKIDKSFMENDCKVSIKLDTSHLTSFYLVTPISVTLHVKYFNKLCKTLKKRDKVSLWIDKESSLHMETKEELLGIQKTEEKEMPITILYDCKESDTPDIDSYFSTAAFVVSPMLIQGIRKSIGTKSSPVELKINEDKYLEFNSTWSGAGLFKMVLGERTIEFGTIIISAGVINILSKLSQLCNKLMFHQQKQQESFNVLKVSGKLDIPFYLGEVCILIRESTKK
jgi:hypothetical protein